MTRIIIAIWASALVICLSDNLRHAVRDHAAVESIVATAKDACTYYRERAGSGLAEDPVRFEAILSDSCAVAIRSLRGAPQDERTAAAFYLTRVAQLHRVIQEMNAQRGALDPTPGATQGPGPVTPTGEFLIAHRLGVMRAFEAWLDTGADFSLASYR
jgi:hypothetical protein